MTLEILLRVRTISSVPLELRRWSSARHGQRDSNGHPVACAYLEQSPKACLAPSPHPTDPPSIARTLLDSQSTQVQAARACTLYLEGPSNDLKHIRQWLTKYQQAICMVIAVVTSFESFFPTGTANQGLARRVMYINIFCTFPRRSSLPTKASPMVHHMSIVLTEQFFGLVLWTSSNQRIPQRLQT